MQNERQRATPTSRRQRLVISVNTIVTAILGPGQLVWEQSCDSNGQTWDWDWPTISTPWVWFSYRNFWSNVGSLDHEGKPIKEQPWKLRLCISSLAIYLSVSSIFRCFTLVPFRFFLFGLIYISVCSYYFFHYWTSFLISFSFKNIFILYFIHFFSLRALISVFLTLFGIGEWMMIKLHWSRNEGLKKLETRLILSSTKYFSATLYFPKKKKTLHI